jgi:hypothetical protein
VAAVHDITCGGFTAAIQLLTSLLIFLSLRLWILILPSYSCLVDNQPCPLFGTHTQERVPFASWLKFFRPHLCSMNLIIPNRSNTNQSISLSHGHGVPRFGSISRVVNRLYPTKDNMLHIICRVLVVVSACWLLLLYVQLGKGM